MKAELVNLVTKDGAQMVVLLSTDLQSLTREESVRVCEVALWLVDEGWTVMTSADSPLAEVVRRSARALDGTYVALKNDQGMQVSPTGHRMPPRPPLVGGVW